MRSKSIWSLCLPFSNFSKKKFFWNQTASISPKLSSPNPTNLKTHLHLPLLSNTQILIWKTVSIFHQGEKVKFKIYISKLGNRRKYMVSSLLSYVVLEYCPYFNVYSNSSVLNLLVEDYRPWNKIAPLVPEKLAKRATWSRKDELL